MDESVTFTGRNSPGVKPRVQADAAYAADYVAAAEPNARGAGLDQAREPHADWSVQGPDSDCLCGGAFQACERNQRTNYRNARQSWAVCCACGPAIQRACNGCRSSRQ